MVSHMVGKGMHWYPTEVSVLALVFGALLVAVLALGLAAAAAFFGVVAFFTLVAAVLGFTAALALVAFGLASLGSALGAFSFCKVVSIIDGDMG